MVSAYLHMRTKKHGWSALSIAYPLNELSKRCSVQYNIQDFTFPNKAKVLIIAENEDVLYRGLSEILRAGVFEKRYYRKLMVDGLRTWPGHMSTDEILKEINQDKENLCYEYP